jgi:hypothetical protein
MELVNKDTLADSEYDRRKILALILEIISKVFGI